MTLRWVANRLHSLSVYLRVVTTTERTSSPGWRRFGAYVRQQRLDRELTGAQMAEKLNAVTHRANPYSQGHVSAYEGGTRLFPEVVRDYVLALNLDWYTVGRVMLDEEDDTRERQAVLFAFIDSDPALDDERRAHLKQQYLLLTRRPGESGDARPDADGDPTE